MELKLNKEMILPTLAGVLGVWSIASVHWSSNPSLIVVAFVGIGACASYFLKGRFTVPLTWFWVFAQFPSITWTSIAPVVDDVTLERTYGIVDAGQLEKFAPLGFTGKNRQGEFDIRLNLVPFAYVALYRFFALSVLIGKRTHIARFGKEHQLADAFPIEGSVASAVTLSGDKGWLVITLDKPIQGRTANYTRLLVKPKEENSFRLGAKPVVSHMRLVNSDPSSSNTMIKEEAPSVGWGLVKITR